MKDWSEKTLGEFVSLQRGHDLPTDSRGEGNIPVVGSFGITGYHDVAKAKGPGVTVGRSGASAGTVVYVEQDYWPHNTCLFVKDFNGNNPRFAYYLLSTLDLASHAAGSAQPSLNRNHIAPLPLSYPSRPEQDEIASFLSALDDKIEVNRRMNETLEALAQAVFKDWFVTFGPTRRKMEGDADPVAILGGLIPDPTQAAPLATLFPDSFDADGLPEGWEAKTLGDVVEPRKGRNITKKTVIAGQVPVVAGGLSPAYFHNTPNVIGPVITASASGANAGFVRLYFQDIWASDCSFISGEQTDYLFTIYVMLSSRQDEIYSMQQGAAQPHIYPSDLKRLAISDAPTPIWQALEDLLAPFFELIANNEKQNRTLAETRDYLLPKLMSGAVRVRDAAAMVEGADA